jgi:TonB-dependent receptor
MISWEHNAKGETKVRHFISVLGSLVITILFLSTSFAAGNAVIEGYVKDAKTGEPLFGANIILKGTGLGAATSMDGKYAIPNVPPGAYTVRATYIGYNPKESEVNVAGDSRAVQDIKLTFVGVEGETVTITAQASGQTQAINQQLSSDQIINVVSAARIQELPDANAAESVGRLPGVTVLRSGGEGNTVVIRGLQPKYNKILIDGVQMSSPNPGDRTTDLSTVSSSMLDGIQVAKSVTSDMDADVLGGTVNFSLREARSRESDTPLLEALVQGGYNNLSNAHNKFNNYKFVISGENRFLDNDLGVFAQFDMERKNLTSNELGAVYTHAGVSTTEYYTTGLGLYYIPRDRQRFNGALVMDYKLPDGKIKLSNFVSSGSTETQSRYEFFDIAKNMHLWQLSNSTGKLTTIANAIGLEQQLPIFLVDLKLSHTYSEVNNPDDWTVNFLQTAAGVGQFTNVANVDPEDIPKAANNDFSQAITNGIVTSHSFSRERALTGSLDLKANLFVNDYLNVDIKFGGKYRYQTRSYEYDLYNGGGLQFGDAAYINDLIISHFHLPVDRYKISLPYFADPNFSYGTFLDGNYSMGGALDYGKLAELVTMIKSHTDDIANFPGAAQVYGHNNFASNSNNYSGDEKQSAVYLMSVINLGQDITLIPGIRYQNLQTSYSGVRGIQNRLSYLTYNHYDTTVSQVNGYWLPNISLRYKPYPWCDIRLSYTHTLAYPDFNAVIPRIDVDGNNGTISWNNFSLVPQRSTNYDLYLSFYDNAVGLLTVGGFSKEIDNLIYGWSFYASATDAANYYPPGYLGTTTPSGTYLVNTFVNNTHRATDYGIELDWQTHFWYLPAPFSGLVLNVNYTRIFSEAEYPYTFIRIANRKTTYVDTTFTDRLLDQPDDLLNISLGYDYEGFSARVSMLYQTDIFTGVNFWPQLRSHTAAYRRWDIALKQQLPWRGLQLYCNLNNVNGANDVSVIQGGGVPLAEQQYGLSVDFGLRWKW